MNTKTLTTTVIFQAWLSITQSSNILSIAPSPGKSFFNYNHAILKSLANVGHRITIITQFAEESAQENFTSIIDISRGQPGFIGQALAEEFSKKTFQNWQEFFAENEFSLCRTILNLKEIKDFIKSEEKLFDVMMITILYHPACYYEIAQKLNIPVIAIIPQRSCFTTDLEISNTRHPLLIPMEVGSEVNPNNFMSRVLNALEYTKNLYHWYTMTNSTHNNFKKYVKPAIVFINSHASYFPRPLNPNMIEIGGIQINENQPLPEEIENFLNGAERGAILFTLGSVLRAASLPGNKIQAFVDAFSEIPQRVIWKYEEQMDKVPSNVMLMKWLPQNDILAHKNVKAFISHCGQGAIHESLYNAVPLISCPIFMDQPVNAKIFENLEVAVHLDYETITKESILEAINEVINNTIYYEKMQKLSPAFRDRPMSPQQTVVYWTEYVIKHKGALHLMSPAMELNWFQYYLLDVISFVIFIVLMILYAIYFICNLTYSYVTLFGILRVKNKSH